MYQNYREMQENVGCMFTLYKLPTRSVRKRKKKNTEKVIFLVIQNPWQLLRFCGLTQEGNACMNHNHLEAMNAC
jgi:hypothetical protein